MWALGLLFLAVLFAAGLVVGLLWFFLSPKQSRPRLAMVAAIPFGCVLMPVVCLVLLVALAALDERFQKSDFELYQEIFGSGTTVRDQSMLFDEFGHGRSREIYMRIYPDGHEREKLFSVPGLKPSETSLADFIARGSEHGFTWWPSSDPDSREYCQPGRVLEADGFRGWREFRLTECIDQGGTYFPEYTNGSRIYVIARHRID